MLQQKESQILVVFPHPDDEAFGTSGTLAQYANAGVPITYACLTLGEMGRNLGNPPFATRETLPLIRKAELEASAKAIGIQDLRMMGLRDKTVEFEDDEKMVQMMTSLIDELNPSLIMTFYPNYAVHPDHEATAKAVVRAVRRMAPADRPRLYGLAFANNTLAELGQPDITNDIRDVKEHKMNSMKAHSSQTGWMMQEESKREEDGDTAEHNWFTDEGFYSYRWHEDFEQSF
ncbi:bacillithiol biosynthesis deacetylase BshB2 [Kurthia sibirica]|uniref:Bacillithiol biosynthesis deacetylase BshB2 n=1 Tax=Kurthia sibirica TaxID=202750 RepID=A0A2U3AH50_9BACL|nr:bacillithiol biosynthesis deacetylase BshB2 [Kurthia sibirica]PWI23869.1 bacillithiol biosynthesis deacetylase BshB2 [Kurthia sibirica]GEK35056.1 bacillithiol biosynthesis deacetylase BshB2 [Kurthia sibirica]